MTNGDLISREALKKAVYAEFGNSNLTDAFNEIIDNAPTVDTYTIEDIKEVQENSLILGAKLAQRPQGEWNYIQAGMCVCPFCGEVNVIPTNFCPYCGLPMKKGGADND